ncbi:serine threonine- kinase pim-1-like protein [Labeo rohita]|uniref:non-specific serine/threonine protein kinase n=1 Tax=Labeo rohita TaxID=84645 RepID=A0A498LLR4_LABRO|nr:serine threonine- kinase pim-1-like protein [Labeo rohita]
MGQRVSRREKAERGGECVDGVNPRTTLTPTDHTAELHPRPDETPVGTGEGGGQERKERGGDKTKKKRQKKRRFRRFASFFCCLSRPKSTKAQGEQVEQGEEDQGTDGTPSRSCTDDQTSLQDVTCSVEDNDHQEAPFSAPEVPPAAEDQQMEDVQPQDQDSPVSLSADHSPSHLLRHLDCDKIMSDMDPICWTYSIGEKLGEGGCGSVFAGTRVEDGLQVAVKFTEKGEDEPYLSLPDHPNPVPAEVALTVMANQGPRCHHIIELLDWQDNPDHYIMVLERPSPCMDMHDFFEHHGDLFTEALVRHFMRQAIDAAVVCCSRGVFHRDIKMSNLLVNTETMEVKLIDFGVGDLLKSSPYIFFSGTANFCPPEYFTKGEYLGKQATVWSLGVLLFNMMTNRYPYSSDIKLMDANVWTEPDFSDECCRFIRGCLKSDPEQRVLLEEMLSHDWFKQKLLRLQRGSSFKSSKMPFASPRGPSHWSSKGSCHRQTGPKEIWAASEINVNAALLLQDLLRSERSEYQASQMSVDRRILTQSGHTDTRHVHHKGSSHKGKEQKEVPVKAAPVFAVVASASAGVKGSFSPRAPLSTSLVPEVPAKAALV